MLGVDMAPTSAEGIALDGDRRSVEFCNREFLEVLPGVVIALVGKDAERHRLAEQQPVVGIGAPMNPREVACLTDVRGELVDFTVERDLARIQAGIGDQRVPSWLAVTMVPFLGRLV